jgi:hypothetical protein
MNKALQIGTVVHAVLVTTDFLHRHGDSPSAVQEGGGCWTRVVGRRLQGAEETCEVRGCVRHRFVAECVTSS